MKNCMMILPMALVLVSAVTLYGQEVKTIRNIDAADKTAYFNLATGKEVDASADWDIAFNRTNILVNGGSSGTGKAMALLLKDTSFDEVTKQPQTGFKTDSTNEKAIPSGSGNGWYEYNMANHSINPILGRIIVVKTTSGKYAKLEVIGYYHDSNHSPANYSFRYRFL